MRDDMEYAQPHSIWLCPDLSTASYFQSSIDDISRQQGTESFSPHVTLLGDIFAAPRRTEELCRRAFTQVPAVEVRTERLAMTDQFFMSLFIDLSLKPDMIELRHALAEALQLNIPKDFRPHLSLAYGLAGDARQSHFEYIQPSVSPGRQFFLDTVVIAASSSRLPINQWKSLSEIKLSYT